MGLGLQSYRVPTSGITGPDTPFGTPSMDPRGPTYHLSATAAVGCLNNGGTKHGSFGLNVPCLPRDMVGGGSRSSFWQATLPGVPSRPSQYGWVCWVLPASSFTNRWWLVDSPPLSSPKCPGHATANPMTQLQSPWSNCGLRCPGAKRTYGHLILPNHAPPGLTVTAKVNIEVTQENERIPRRSILQYYL